MSVTETQIKIEKIDGREELRRLIIKFVPDSKLMNTALNMLDNVLCSARLDGETEILKRWRDDLKSKEIT